MAILTFEIGEGMLETVSPSHRHLDFTMLFGRGKGQLGVHEVLARVRRIRDIGFEEAPELAQFLLEAGALNEFRRRMAPEDWERLVTAVPPPRALAA